MTSAPPAKPAPGRRGGGVYLAGSLLGQGCALLRYTILARLLGPEQLGLVATLVLVSNFFEMISDTGSDRFLVQDREGDKPEVQRLVQLVFIGRGLFMAIGLVLVAWPVAAYFGQPPLFAGLAVLALAPLITGLTHLDMRRLQRSSDFRAEGVGMIFSELAGLVATLVAAFVVQDFTAILYGLITRAAVMVLVSHFTAQRPYGLEFAREHARRLSAFAAPLILNGALLFMASQSDRLLVSGLVGLEALGYYTSALLLVLYPSVALSRFIQGIHLPLVAADPVGYSRTSAADVLGGRSFLLALGMALGFTLVGPLAIVLLYGPTFAQPMMLVAMIGVLQSGRFLRVWTVTLALGLGHSRIVMANTLARMVGIPAAFLGFVSLGGVAGVVAGFMLGEMAALLTGALMLNRARGRPWTHDLDRILAFTFGSAIILLATLAVEHRSMFGLATIPPAAGLAVWIVRREQVTLARSFAMGARLLRRRR